MEIFNTEIDTDLVNIVFACFCGVMLMLLLGGGASMIIGEDTPLESCFTQCRHTFNTMEYRASCTDNCINSVRLCSSG